VLRATRLTSAFALRPDTALQLLYRYRTRVPYLFEQSIEARISRTLRFSRSKEAS
jgi:hypothetical protein